MRVNCVCGQMNDMQDEIGRLRRALSWREERIFDAAGYLIAHCLKSEEGRVALAKWDAMRPRPTELVEYERLGEGRVSGAPSGDPALQEGSR